MRLHRLTIALRTFSIPLRPQTTASPSRYFGRLPLPVSGATVLKAAPTIPFIGSLFNSSAKAESSDDMSYPDQRSDDEWRAVLSPGSLLPPLLLGMSLTANANRTIPHPPRKRNRTPLYRRLRCPLPVKRRLHLRGLRRALIQSQPQVQVRLRLARVL